MTYGTVATDNLTSSTGGVISPNITSLRNRIINGAMKIAQRGTSGTSGSSAPTTSPTYPCVDRFYVYATGATVTASQTTSSAVNYLSIAGASSVTAVGIGQRIEAVNSIDLAGTIATLSLNISNSLLTSVTWTASYAGSTDTWSSKTSIATGTFTVSSTLTNYSVNINIPSAATTGIEILLTVGAQTSGTWVINNMQFEAGTQATSFDYRQYGHELALCQRYYEVASISSCWFFPNIYDNPAYRMCPDFSWHTTKRANPTVVVNGGATAYNNAGGAFAISSYTTSYASVDTYGITCTKSGGNWSTSEPISLINITVTASSEL